MSNNDLPRIVGIFYVQPRETLIRIFENICSDSEVPKFVYSRDIHVTCLLQETARDKYLVLALNF